MERIYSSDISATGYEWYCRHCGALNHHGQAIFPDELTCSECGTQYKVVT